MWICTGASQNVIENGIEQIRWMTALIEKFEQGKHEFKENTFDGKVTAAIKVDDLIPSS